MKKTIILSAAAMIAVLISNSCIKKTPYVPVEPTATPVYSLVWEESFDGPSLDTTAWSYEEQAWPHNEELEYYTARTVNS